MATSLSPSRRAALCFGLGCALSLAAGLALPPRAAADSPDLHPGITLPPGTRTDAQGQLISGSPPPPGPPAAAQSPHITGRGPRSSNDFTARGLARRGITVERIGPYAI